MLYPPEPPSLELPAEVELRATLRHHLGDEPAERLWTECGRAPGTRPSTDPLSPADWRAIADHLARHPDRVVAVLGRSLHIRVATYLLFATRRRAHAAMAARRLAPVDGGERLFLSPRYAT